MALKDKFRIKGLDINKKFCKSSYIILQNKFNMVIKLCKRYLKDGSNENLHQLRIALRRLRYTMEIFVACYKEKEFNLAYKIIQKLQDELGKGRDLDVLLEKIDNFEKFNFHQLKENILKEKEIIKDTIKKEIVKFVEQKNDFNFLIKKR
ncbi:MAG: CHAD domain-containing protein [Stygiobacter sp.]